MNKVLNSGRNVLAVFAYNILWLTLILLLYKWLYSYAYMVDLIKNHDLMADFFTQETPRSMFFLTIISAPLWEEAAFRYAPLTFGKKLIPDGSLLPVAVILSSIVFGWGHGGPLNVWVQGMFGLGQCWLYLKNKKLGYPSCVLTHAMWNAFLGYGLPFLFNS